MSRGIGSRYNAVEREGKAWMLNRHSWWMAGRNHVAVAFVGFVMGYAWAAYEIVIVMRILVVLNSKNEMRSDCDMSRSAYYFLLF